MKRSLICDINDDNDSPYKLEKIKDVIVSANLKYIALTINAYDKKSLEAKCVLWTNFPANQKIRAYDDFIIVEFSQDESQLVYIAKSKNKECLVHINSDSQETTYEYELIKDFTFSDDCKSYAFMGKTGNEYYAVCNGKTSKPYITIDDLRFSSGKWFYTATISTNPTNSARYILKLIMNTNGDEVEVPSPGSVYYYEISPNGKYIVLTGISLENKKEYASVILDGESGPRYDGIENLIFTEDSKHIIYIAKNFDGYYVVFDRTIIATYDYGATIYINGFIKDAGHQKLVYTVKNFEDDTPASKKNTNSAYIYAEYDIESKSLITKSYYYIDLFSVVITSDQTKTAYIASSNRYKYKIVCGDWESEETGYIRPAHIALSPDGSLLAYKFTINFKYALVLVDFNLKRSTKLGTFDDIYTFTFDKNNRLSYIVVVCNQERDKYVINNNQISGPYERVYDYAILQDSTMIYIALIQGYYYVITEFGQMGPFNNVSYKAINSKKVLCIEGNRKCWVYD